MQLTKGAIGNLINRYKAVLKKCHLMNTFGSLAVAGMLIMGGAGVAVAESAEDFSNKEITGETLNSDASYLMGGYIQSSGKKLDEAKFLKNTITHTGNYLQGGIIKRSSYAPELSITNSEFSGNSVSTTGYLQGGIINHDVNEKTTNITKSKFNDNIISTTGHYLQGGIINNNGGTININGSEFNNNDMTSPSYLQGGIINNNGTGESVVVGIQNAKFNDNTINSNGFVQGGIIINDSISGTSSINIVKSEFANNKINSQGSVTGGIILNACLNDGDYIIAIDNTVFSKNEIHSEGNLSGSIINNQEDHKVTINSSSFESNISTVKGDYALGGAIYNKGELTFTGNNTFTDNIVNDKPNDIYNAGTITVKDGTTTLNSGLVLAENGTVTVTGGTLDMASGSTLNMGDGTLTINGGTFVADAGLLIKSGTTTGSYVVNNENKVTDSRIVGTQGNLNLRWFNGDYTLDEYTSVKDALLKQPDEKAELTLLNARLNVEDGQTLVTGATFSSGTATLATGAKVVNNDSTNVATDGTKVPHTPENYVSVVDSANASELLAVSTIATNGNSITAKGLKIAGAAGADAVTLQVTSPTGGNSTLTLVGDSKADTGVIDKDGKALATKAVIDGNSTLNMGLTGNTRDQGLTLTEADVTGTLNANGGVTGTSSEYAINALTMNAGSKVNVLDSTMQIGKFTATGGTMFVDPAYVKIDSVVGDFGTQLLVGSGSTVNIGGMPEADMRQAMEKAGMSVGPNFTVGANQSVLVLGQGITLGATGQIVVDANVTSSGTIPGTSAVATAHFGKDSLLVVNGTKINGNTAALDLGTASSSFTVQNGAKLLISGAQNGKTYKVIANGNGTSAFNGSGYSDSTADGWKGGNLMTSSDMVTLTSGDGMTFTAGVKDARDVFPDLSEGMTNAVNKLYKDSLNNVDSDQMGVRFLSRATDNRFLGADKNAAAESIESAARIAFAGAAPQMTRMASDAGTNAVVNRLGFANPADGAQAMDAEGKIVDRNTTGFALWIAPLWQSQHGWGLDAGNMDYGFNGNLGGVSLGADYTFENAIRAGITFNIGGGYAESSGGDLSSTENRMNFWGLGAYAGWNYENFGVMADVSYTSTWNQLKQDLDSRLGMGNKLEADVQASAISAGLRAEYLLQTSAMDIIPHIGVRYMSLNTWGYDVDTHGGTVLEGDSLHQDIWTFPIGVTFSKDIALDSGWSFKPSLDFSVIPAAGDIKAKHDVHFTGLPGTYEVETQMMDYLTWQGGVGLELANDNMSIGVNYTLQAGQHTTGHGVFGSFRYEF